MIELVDNLIQLAAVLSGFAVSGVFYLKSRRQPYFLLCCFYGCFGSALLYWLLYTVLVARTPSVFYVSDIGWISSFFFLLLLQYSLAGTEERTSWSRLPWLALLIEIPLTVYYISLGDVLYNLIVGAQMTVILWLAIRGIVWGRKHPERGRVAFCGVTAGFILLENGLWISGYPWKGDTLANPYFWFDLGVTAALLVLLPAVRRVVRA